MSVLHPEAEARRGSMPGRERESTARAAEALRALMTDGPALPGVYVWTLPRSASVVAQDGGEVVGQASVPNTTDDEWRSVFADLARRTGGALVESPLSGGPIAHRLSVTFRWRGVRVVLWRHVAPVGDGGAR
ncbi:hypothetical protein [Embleya sp. NPDC059259]|uniref:hypothetical protein n=1 Tax=unclassified Embleya TaxID=2699296 RepID=UPI003684A306